ncbi:NAD(P)-dependent alcohol dehydrogenase [Candidatus Bipolaricaulota bacterium]
MKAIVYRRYGSPAVLKLEEVEKPSPRDDEVLVRVHATSVNATDVENMRGVFMVRLGAPRRPRYRILGSDVAGRIEAVGKHASRFQLGDEVFGDLSPIRCSFGAFAEYVCAHETALAPKPAGMTFEGAAAATSAAILALQALRHKGQPQPGDKVLINGAGGSVGTFAVQMARAFGAEVTGVDSARKLDMLRSIGADHVIDYTQEDFTRSGQRYDRILDVVSQRSVFDYRRALNPHGLCIVVGGSIAAFFQAAILGPWNSIARSKKVDLLTSWEPNREEDVRCLTELIEAGKVTPIIDRIYPLSETAKAVRYLEEGHARGKVVIDVCGSRMLKTP